MAQEGYSDSYHTYQGTDGKFYQNETDASNYGAAHKNDSGSSSGSSSSSVIKVSDDIYFKPSNSSRSSGPSIGDRFLSKLKEAFTSYKNNDIDNASKLCNDALEMYKPYMNKDDSYYAPFVAKTYNLRGVCQQAKGNLQQAINDYHESMYWGDEEAKKNLFYAEEEKKAKEYEKANNEGIKGGDQFLNEGNLDKAILQYTKAIRAGGSNRAVAYMNRAACYVKKGDKDQAKDDYTSAINEGLSGSDLAAAKAELAKLK